MTRACVDDRLRGRRQSVRVSSSLSFHFSRMKLLTSLFFCSLLLGVSSGSFFSFIGEAFQGKLRETSALEVSWASRRVGFTALLDWKDQGPLQDLLICTSQQEAEQDYGPEVLRANLLWLTSRPGNS